MTSPKPQPGVVLHALPDGTHALTDAEAGEMLVLNEVGAAVWLLLDTCDSIEELTTHLVEVLTADPEQARADVRRFLEELERRGFVQ